MDRGLLAEAHPLGGRVCVCVCVCVAEAMGPLSWVIQDPIMVTPMSQLALPSLPGRGETGPRHLYSGKLLAGEGWAVGGGFPMLGPSP